MPPGTPAPPSLPPARPARHSPLAIFLSLLYTPAVPASTAASPAWQRLSSVAPSTAFLTTSASAEAAISPAVLYCRRESAEAPGQHAAGACSRSGRRTLVRMESAKDSSLGAAAAGVVAASADMVCCVYRAGVGWRGKTPLTRTSRWSCWRATPEEGARARRGSATGATALMHLARDLPSPE